MYRGNYTTKRGKVYQYDLDGNFIREFKHCVDAYKTLKCSSNLYYHLEKGYPKTIQGCVFSYKLYMKYPSKLLPKKTLFNYTRYKSYILQFDLNGNLVEQWSCNPNIISKTLNINRSNIGQCLNNKRKTAGGYIWKYKE
jgi:hypothetical protein